MRQQLVELNARYGNLQTLRLIYILFVLLAMAVVGGAPAAYYTNISGPGI